MFQNKDSVCIAVFASDMPVKVTLVTGAEGTEWASIWLLSTVCAEVLLQTGLYRSSVRTNGTRERFFPCVDPVVSLQVYLVGEPPVALRTN